MVWRRQLMLSPREPGEALAAALTAKDGVIDATVAGPGFGNLN